MTYTLAVVVIALMILALFLLMFGLPGNWVVIALAGIWELVFDAPSGNPVFGWKILLLMVGLGVLGEILEFWLGNYGAKKYGGSGKGSLGGMIGAFVGAILGAGFLLGFGALPGALAGAFTGCFIMEKICGKASGPAATAAWGATLGRFGGFVVKLGLGITLVYMSATHIWAAI